jgi:hypothetical protein
MAFLKSREFFIVDKSLAVRIVDKFNTRLLSDLLFVMPIGAIFNKDKIDSA